MHLTELIQALAEGANPQSLGLMMLAEGASYQQENIHLFTDSLTGRDYVVKLKSAGAHSFDSSHNPEVVPPFIPPVYPPEQYTAGRWLVQKKYLPLDPFLWVIDRPEVQPLTDEEHAALDLQGTIGAIDLQLANIGRDPDTGKVHAFDWLYRPVEQPLQQAA